jgi:hypothetical protein
VCVGPTEREIIINDAKINHSVVFGDLCSCARALSSCGSIMHLECFIVLFQVAECYCPARNMHLFDIETSAVLKVGRRRAALYWDIVKRSKYCREKIYYKRYMHAGSAFIERLSICRRGEGENNNNAHAALQRCVERVSNHKQRDPYYRALSHSPNREQERSN